VEAAVLIRQILAELGLKGYAKTTGGDGMHIYVPLEPVYTYEQMRGFAELVSHLAVDREPNLFTTPRSVEKRKKDRVYFDYLQIGKSKTISAPYVVRAYDGAPVATPLDWKEVVRGLRPNDFRIDNSIERFRRVGDLFAPVLQGGQKLETALARLQGDDEKPKKAAHASSATRRKK
jgi:bifunctional non-homologous end joining protein LigD